jgi:DNA-binding MarR family transcriptional regulator
MNTLYKALFGNEVAELCLLYIVNYGQGHIRGIANTFEVSPGQVKPQLEKLEADGILVSQFIGNTKNFRINPRLAIRAELTALIEKILSLLPEEDTEKYFRERRRPRRTAKPL